MLVALKNKVEATLASYEAISNTSEHNREEGIGGV
jgi:hypothetical protein